MTPYYQIRLDDYGRTGLYINDVLVIFNLDAQDRNNFNREFGEVSISPNASYSLNSNTIQHLDPSNKSGSKRGRKLLLARHEVLIRDFIEQDSLITALEIQNKLRRMGIKFSGISAVNNLARSLGIKLAA